MVWIIVFVIVIFIIAAAFSNSDAGDYEDGNEYKGVVGEMDVALSMSDLPEDVYNSFHDIYVPGRGDSVTQIDHIIVSRYGVFVVETKNYSGWLFGKENQRNWVQILAYGKYKKQFSNPLWQNKGHIDYLARHLKMPQNKFHSVVCFTGDGDIRTPMPDYVMTQGWDNYYILEFQEKILSEQEERYAIDKINELKSALHLEAEHKNYLQKRANNRRH